MLLKHCGYCENQFFTESDAFDLARVLCVPCLARCQVFWPQLKAAVAESTTGKFEDIIASVNAPTKLLEKMLLSLGVSRSVSYYVEEESTSRADEAFPRQTAGVAKPEALEKRPCTICKRALKGAENVYCLDCQQVIDKRMHSRREAEAVTAKTRGGAYSGKKSESKHQNGMGRIF